MLISPCSKVIGVVAVLATLDGISWHIVGEKYPIDFYLVIFICGLVCSDIAGFECLLFL